MEYLKNIRTLKPYTLKRRGYGYHESATMIREEMREENPEKFQRIDRAYWELVGAKILQTDSKRLETIFSAGEGLGNKLKNEIRYVSSTEQPDRKNQVQSLYIQQNFQVADSYSSGYRRKTMRESTKYIRILALDDVGAKFLKEVKKKSCATLPILTNINKEAKDFPGKLPPPWKKIFSLPICIIL